MRSGAGGAGRSSRRSIRFPSGRPSSPRPSATGSHRISWPASLGANRCSTPRSGRSPTPIGLMQLLPETARNVASRAGLPGYHRGQLTVPQVNLMLGTRYLSDVLDRFDRFDIAGMISYNAGPQRYDRWRDFPSSRTRNNWSNESPTGRRASTCGRSPNCPGSTVSSIRNSPRTGPDPRDGPSSRPPRYGVLTLSDRPHTIGWSRFPAARRSARKDRATRPKPPMTAVRGRQDAIR